MTSTSRPSRLPLLLGAFGVVLLVQALFVTSYVGALHRAQPRSVPFGVVGTPALAAAVAQRFSLHTRTYADEAAALRAINHRTVYGALVTDAKGARLIVAPAAGATAALGLTTAFTTVAAAGGVKLAVVQVHPLPPGDRSGAVSFLVAMALVVGGYLSATIATTVAAAATGRRGRAPILAAVAVLGALVTDVVAGPILGALPTDKFFVLWALFAFLMLAVAYAAAALQTLFGVVGTLIVIVVFVIFGAPAAGGTLPRPFLPTFWSTIGPYLPPGAGTNMVRNTIYFGGNGIGLSLIVLAVYLVVGGAIVLRGRPSPEQPAEEAAGIETAASSAVVIT